MCRITRSFSLLPRPAGWYGNETKVLGSGTTCYRPNPTHSKTYSRTCTFTSDKETRTTELSSLIVHISSTETENEYVSSCGELFLEI